MEAKDMDQTSVIRDMLVLAGVLDERCQYDLSDRMERLAQFDPGSIREESFGGFDEEDPRFRGNPQTKLNWERDPEGGRRVRRPWWLSKPPVAGMQGWDDQERTTEGERPWLLGEEAMTGNEPGEFDQVHGHPGDPWAPASTHTLDRDQIIEQVMEDLRKKLPDIQAETDEEFISKLIHAHYVELRYGGDDDIYQQFEEMAQSGQPIDYDQDILRQAKDDVGSWISDMFQRVEEEMQENYVDEDPEPVTPWKFM